nr:cilia- and flagella-associated protein 99 [Anolis sagrei ordinatus]XP_060625291.1 cilia- and flagella-associated protein 99 [Anolis sagrei ordinatus]
MDARMRHIEKVIQRLNQLNPVTENIGDFLEESAHVLQNSKVKNETFLMETLAGCIEFKPLLDVVVSAFYSRDGKHCLLSERNLYIVVCYLAIFQLEELGLREFSRIIKSLDVPKICKFLRFFFNRINLSTWIKDEWNKMYDSVYVNNNWIKPLQRWQPKIQQMIDGLDDKFDKHTTITSKITKPQEFNLTVPNPRAILIPELIPQQEKTRPVPANTYKIPKMGQKLEQIKSKNRRKAEELLLEANMNQFRCAAPKFEHKSPVAMEVLNPKKKFHAQRIKGKIDNIPVKLNATAILREGVLYQRKVEEELNRIEHLLRGARDPSEYLEWQEQMRRKDLDQQLTEEECRRLQGKLSYEEAIVARQNCIRENQKKAEQEREMEEVMSHHCEQRKLKELRGRQKTVQQVTEARKNVKQAQMKLQKCKRQIAQEVAEESQEILARALKEEEEKAKKRYELIQQIRAIEYVPFIKNKFVDLTQTPNHGVLGEMSIVELQERLALLKDAQKKAEEEKRDQIIHEKYLKEQLLLDTLEQISVFREQLGRAAALKQEEKKIKKPFHEAIWKDKRILDLQEKIEEKLTQRKMPPGSIQNEPEKFNKGVKKSLISQKRSQREEHWKKLEESQKAQFKMLQRGFMSRELAQKMAQNQAMINGASSCILRPPRLVIQHHGNPSYGRFHRLTEGI